MFEILFFTFLRSVAIPVTAFLFLRDTYLGERGALLAVSIALSLVSVFVIISQIIKILPNTLLLRSERVLGLILSILVEVVCVIAFWSYYLVNFA